MDGDALLTIGDLARRTGLTVKAIRFYSDRGLVPPTTRSPAGYRLYDVGALARLEYVRALRELGIDLPTVQRLLDRDLPVAQVAEEYAEALDRQIRVLRLRRAVLRVVARRGSTLEETELMHRLAKLSNEERHRLVTDFIDEVLGDLDANPEWVAMMRSAMPDLPDDPDPAQVDAWVELAELVQNPDFRAAVRRLAEYQAAERAQGDTTGLHHELTEEVRDRVGAAVAAGVDSASPQAAAIVGALATRYAQTFGRADDARLRDWMLDRLEVADEPFAERYLQLLAVINGWPAPPSMAPLFGWFMQALRAGR